MKWMDRVWALLVLAAAAVLGGTVMRTYRRCKAGTDSVALGGNNGAAGAGRDAGMD